MTFNIDEMSVLDRRRIEAGVLGPVFKAFSREIGEEKAREIIGRTIVEIAKEQGRALAERSGGNDLKTFAKAKEPWTRNAAIETETIKGDEENYSFNVIRCRYAEMYKELGIPELGFLLSCGRDFAMSQGFNPEIKLTRTQTIMQGASHCDFRYAMSDVPKTAKSKGA